MGDGGSNDPRDADLTDYATLALAGVVQAAELVYQVANGRTVDEYAERALVHAVTTQNAAQMSAVFPEPQAFRLGLDSAVKALSGQPEHNEAVRYTLELLDLARRLKGNGAVVNLLKQRRSMNLSILRCWHDITVGDDTKRTSQLLCQ